MLKIRALNEPHCSSESEDEDNPRLSKEAQESNAIALYNEALRCQQRNDPHEAVDTFQRILDLPYLNEFENKSLSPLQTQTRLGCLKCLSSLYTTGPTKNLSRALEIFEFLTALEPSNVNNWYRYGKVALELEDFSLAFEAFQWAHSCSNGHWGCIEKLVTLSYVLHDMQSCLKYCALGLVRDPAFVKGIVFRDYVFKMNPWIHNSIQSKRQGFESLFVGETSALDDSIKNEYLDEARNMLRNYTKRQILLRQQENDEQNKMIKCPYHMKTASFVELCRVVVMFQKYIKELGNLLSPADISGIISQVPPSNDLLNGSLIENRDEQRESSTVLRSRSSSDDKDIGTSSYEAGASSGVIDNEDKSAEDDSQSAKDTNSTQCDGTDEDSAQKRKARRDIKWWQLEGKRRSQRVRGNLMPTSPNKPKSENCFAETLKNVIPPLLMSNENSNSQNDKEKLRSPQKKSATHVNKIIYFGTTQEADDVRRFVEECPKTGIIAIISNIIRLLCREFKGNWPPGLDDLFLDLFNTYTISTNVLTAEEYNINAKENVANDKHGDNLILGDELFLSLTAAELLMYSTKANSMVNSVMCDYGEVTHNRSINDTEYILRKMWMQVKHCFKLCKEELMEYSVVQHLLRTMTEILNKQTKVFSCYAATQTDFMISAETVQEKIMMADKMEKLNKINDLYQEKNYEALVDILQFSLTTGDGDLKNHYYLAESYYSLKQIDCVEQCAKVCESAIRTHSNELLEQAVALFRNIWNDMNNIFNLNEYKWITNALLQILIYYEKHSTEEEVLSSITEPWCLLHSVLLHQEEKDPAFYIEEDSVPNSVLLLQLGHEFFAGIGKCCLDDGQFLSYTMDVLLKLQDCDDYWAHEETKTCLDQSILCLFAHPNKKYKLKTVKDHGSTGINLSWNVCCQLFQYYKLEDLPEFDSYDSISIEVENLFQRIVLEIPENLVPKEDYKKMTDFVEGRCNTKPDIPWNIPTDISDIYYLIGDFHFKNKDLQKAIEFYVWDLSVRPYRFDSWAAIALSKAEDIYSKLNSCDRFCIEKLTSKAQAVVRCFQTALDLDETNSKVRVEFGSFLYALHSIYSRELKFHTHQFSLEMFEVIEKKKNEYLLQAEKWFEPYLITAETKNEEGSQNEDVWINHYMLGKVTEKLHPNDPEVFLKQYELAGKLLHAQGAPYPAKINYYNAPEFALEALEIYYRIHASILTLVERIDYSESTEELLMSFLERAETSPFIKSKQGRGGESGEPKKRKGCDESASKKELSEISDLMYEIIGSVEEILCRDHSESSNDSFDSGTATTEDSSDEISCVAEVGPKKDSVMSSFSLSAFKDKMKEKELRQTKLAEEANKSVTAEIATQKASGEIKPQILLSTLRENSFHPDFVNMKFGKVISCCLKAMKECIARYPQSFKSYYRLAYCYKVFAKDLNKAREYFMGNNIAGANKILGLYGERKPNNFFNGIWRNPSDDVDRPGSFPFHMAKSVQLLLSISQDMHDHQLLAEMGIQLSKIPDSHNAYLFTEDREQFSKEAIRSCVTSAKKTILTNSDKLVDCGTRIYDTYTKFQKHAPRENVIAPVLLDMYKKYIQTQMVILNTNAILLSDAVKFFQHLAWTKTNSNKSLSNTYKQGENSKKNSTEDKPLTIPAASTTNDDLKRASLRKHTVLRRASDQDRASSNEQIQSRNTADKVSPQVPSLLSTMEMVNVGIPEMSANLMAYANQLSSYFAAFSPPTNEDQRSSKHPQSQSQSSPHTTALSKNNVAIAKRDMPQTSNVTSQISFSSQPSLPSVNQLISNVSRAIAASIGSNHSIEDKKSVVQLVGNDKALAVAKNNHSTDTFKNRTVPEKPASQKASGPQNDEKVNFATNPNSQAVAVAPKQTLVACNINANKTDKSMYRKPRMPYVGSRVLCPIRSAVPVVRKPLITNQKTQAPGMRPRPMINTSPFQAQTTAMHKPSISDFSMGSSRAPQLFTTGIPPAAHYQGNYTSRPSSFENEQEVVDLTTKSPEKNHSLANSIDPLHLNIKPRPTKRPISSNYTVKETRYPLPPKKKHLLIPRDPLSDAPHSSDVEVITIE